MMNVDISSATVCMLPADSVRNPMIFPAPLPFRVMVLPAAALAEATVAAMAEVYLAHYDGSSEELFRHDLLDKDDVVLMYHDKRLVGFTTLKTWETSWRERPVRVVFSGDTIVERAHWGQPALSFACIARIGQIRRARPDVPLYWFLIVKGHRTFKYLSVFAYSFFPHWKQAHPDLQGLAAQLARERFGEFYDREKGVIHFPSSRGHLKAEIAEARAEELLKPSTRFFLQKNPGYRQGDELVCLCELETDNLKPLAARIFNGH